MNSKRVTVMIAVLLVAGAFIAYEAVKAQMKPSRQLETLRQEHTEEHLQSLLRDFLIGAGQNDPAAHDRFWADDLIYTGASGTLKTKAEIMQSVREEAAKPSEPDAPKPIYSAEDVVIHDLGDFAIVNFRLLARTDDHGKQQTAFYRNTGTFARRNGQWKVVAWQATKIEPDSLPSRR
jgi:ketosteroid isomerase-like protein